MTTCTPKLIDWSQEFSVGIPSIDSQHQRLVELINDLHAAMMSGKGSQVLGKTLDGMIAYTITHFTYEEKLMRQTGFPGLEAHCAEHGKLLETAKKLQADHRGGKVAISLDTMNFLKQWLRGHIAGSDRLYGPHLVQAGIR